MSKRDNLTKKLQVLLTEDEVNTVNRIILTDALDNDTRPISTSAFIRELIQQEIRRRTPEQRSITKDKIKNLKPNNDE